MSRTTEISAALRATCGEAPAIGSHVERVRALATNLMNQAAAHGWAGVASSMQGAVEPLGTAIEQLAEYKQAGEGAVVHLDQVDDERNVTQVSQHLACAEQELSTAGDRLDTAIALLDDAIQACNQAGQKGLPASLNALREEVIEARGRVRQSAQDCAAERQEAEVWPEDDSLQGQSTGAADRAAGPETSDSRSSGRVGSETHTRIEKELASHPPLADVIVKLVDDHQTHPLNVAADLKNPARRERTLALLKELADGETLKDGTLDIYLRDNPGTGPVFEHVDSSVNQNSDGNSRKQAFVDECKEQYPERAVGPEPTPSEREAVRAYASDLSEKVEAEVEREVSAICPPGATFSVRTKSAAGLFDKVGRMTESGRSTYEVGDVIDAVGARITVEDMPQLASALKAAEQRLGTGDGGRILEIENMYADPKSRSPEYRVIPMIVRVDVDGKPYTYELQLTTRRASVAADVGHNTIYKHYHELTDTQRDTIKKMQSEAAALDQEETRR